MALGSDNKVSDYFIFMKIEDRVFAQTEFLGLSIAIKMNSAPTGELTIVDRSGLGLSPNDSGKLMMFEFDNATDNTQAKNSTLMCLIDSVEEIDSNTENNNYRIHFSAGSSNLAQTKSGAYTGASPYAIEQIFSGFKASSDNGMNLVPLNSSVKFTDTMTWKCISENFWESMATVVNRSYRENDYLFWAWDDVNNAITVSTLENAKGLPDKYVFIQNDNAIASTEVVRRVNENPDYTTWTVAELKRSNTLGSSKKDLFPNSSLGMANGTKQVTGEIRNECFAQTMSSMGNTKGQDISDHTGLGSNLTYGKAEVVRQNPNDTHNMYGVADKIRNYIMGTYSKRVKTLMYNNAGPSVGSKVLLLCAPNNAKTGTMEAIDYTFSDVYIVAAKYITFTSVGVDKIGRITPDTPKQRTAFELISDNFAGDGKQAIEKISKEFKWV